MIKAILLSSAAFAVFFAVHLIVFHYVPVKRKFRTMLFIAVFSLFLYTLLYVLGNPFLEKLSLNRHCVYLNFVNAVFLYISAYYIYFYFIVFAYRSITARFMVEIDRHHKREVHLDELKKSFSFKKKLETEIEDMLDIGRLEKRGEHYSNTPKGCFHGKLIESLKKFLRLEEKR